MLQFQYGQQNRIQQQVMILQMEPLMAVYLKYILKKELGQQ